MFFLTSIFKGFLSQLVWIWGSKFGFKKVSPIGFFAYFCSRAVQERSRALQEQSTSAPRALQERPKSSHEHPRASQERPKSVPRAEKNVKTRKNMQKPTKTQKDARKRAKIPQNDKKIHAEGFWCTATTWMNFQCRPILRCTTSERCVSERFIVMDGYSSADPS